MIHASLAPVFDKEMISVNSHKTRFKSEIEAIASLLERRVRENYSAGDDEYKLGLVIQGGGMRGIVAAGMVSVLAEGGYGVCFDAVYGASSGACVGAYFLSNQVDDGRKIYTEDICNREYINQRKFFSRPAIVDTEKIVNEVIRKKRALNTSVFTNSDNRLNVITTDARTGDTVAHNRFPTDESLFTALHASLCVPGPREPGILIDGQRYLDGAISDPVSAKLASTSNCTHLLILATRRRKDYRKVNKLVLGLESMTLGLMYGKKLGLAYHGSRSSPYLETLESGEKLTNVIVREDDAVRCRWNTFESSVLDQAFHEGRRAVTRFLNID